LTFTGYADGGIGIFIPDGDKGPEAKLISRDAGTAGENSGLLICHPIQFFQGFFSKLTLLELADGIFDTGDVCGVITSIYTRFPQSYSSSNSSS
jgi:hypothetical protein